MNLLIIVFFIFVIATACNNNGQSEEHNGGYEEGAEPTAGNDDKPEPVAADYVKAATCVSDSVTITYTEHIQTIVNTRCASTACHDASTKAFEINMTSYNGTRRVFEEGKGFCSITHDANFRCEHMPTGLVKLPERQISQLLCWAKNGFAE